MTEDQTTIEAADEAADTDQAAEPTRTEAVTADTPSTRVDDRPPRGMDPSGPPDADPEPLPIGITEMWRIARKTYRA